METLVKVDIPINFSPVRGADVVEGNVYVHPRGRPFFKIVVGVLTEQMALGRRKWNNVIMLHVDATGQVVGASQQPILYVKNHQDLVGKVRELPSLKIEWIKEGHSR